MIASATGGETNPGRIGMEEATERIWPEAVRAHLEFLADDLLEGRGTGSRGHKLAVKYLRAQCEASGLRGAAEGGSFFQRVPLVRATVEEKVTTFEVKAADGTKRLVYGTDFVALDTHRDTEAGVSAGVVFAGFGVTAPEQGYDDYAGLDVTGKIVAMFGPEAPSSFPPAVRAYYSDGDVKRANAVAHGAIGLLGILSPAAEKRLPWALFLRQVRFNSLRWLDANGQPGGLGDSLKISGLLNRSGAEVLFSGERPTLGEVFAGAEKGAPPRFVLSKSVAVKFRSRHEKVESDNVVAVLEGSDPVLKREYVLYSTHVDHLGIADAVDGDSIYNGAMDNAGGCAVLLEVARAFGALHERPRRSVIFLFVTAEEAGFLGSDYFACHPTVPRGQIVADINFDGATTLTPVSDVVAFGSEHSSLRTAIQRAANRIGFTVSPDPLPEEGIFVRSDQFSFVKKGTPATMLALGFKSTRPGVDALAVWKQWLVTVYHSPKDDMTQPICYESSAQLARFAFRLGHAIAMETERPRWNDGDFFGKKFGAHR
ncbi:MAG: M28 family metallopeptidase [Phycisphaerae bacterium]|nr:M28 family metallopeptidase [Phycisphaerae bacterium]